VGAQITGATIMVNQAEIAEIVKKKKTAKTIRNCEKLSKDEQ
jgi:hypothetical protein